LTYLEVDDVLVEKQMLRVQSKTRYDEQGKLLYKYKAKANSEREVPISKQLMQRIRGHINNPLRPKSRLVFCTRTANPDTHLWDKLQAIAKRAGLGKFDLKTFRATRATDWLRPKWLSGCGYDVPTVKNLLGHDRDGEAIWAYLKAIENEVLVAQMNKEERESEERKRRGKGRRRRIDRLRYSRRTLSLAHCVVGTTNGVVAILRAKKETGWFGYIGSPRSQFGFSPSLSRSHITPTSQDDQHLGSGGLNRSASSGGFRAPLLCQFSPGFQETTVFPFG